jgi:hypothetical protein
MPKVLIEIKNATVTSVETTSDDIEVYVFDHDMISEGGISEVKCYLGHADEYVEVDAVVPEDELMADLENLIAEGEALLDQMRGAPDDEEEFDEAEEA